MDAHATARGFGKIPTTGWWGLIEFVEPHVRRVVADRLGVTEARLESAVSLVDDLAADSLDTLEVALALEADLGIELPEDVLADVRLYGELVGVVAERVRAQHVPPAARVDVAVPVQARIVSGRSAGTGGLQRAEWLTPYVAQELTDDARRAGPGGRLELTVPETADDATLLAVRRRFASLVAYGLEVRVARGGGVARPGRTPAAA